jgi:hypothetical protein
VRLELPLPPDAAGRARVEVEPGYDYHRRIYPALPALLGERLSAAGLALLQRAEALAGGTAYRLYDFACPIWSGAEAPCDAQP